MPTHEMSIDLADDAIRSYARLRAMARALSTVSGSIAALARDVTRAYFAALTNPGSGSWVVLVAASATLAREVGELESLFALSDRKCEAREFFAAIARENADLLAVEVTALDDMYRSQLIVDAAHAPGGTLASDAYQTAVGQ